MYDADLAHIQVLLAALRARGLRNVSRSSLLRYAVSLVDPATVPAEALTTLRALPTPAADGATPSASKLP